MIISMTPTRISFLGGGTDYPEYFSQHGGATLASSIDKYIYITINPLKDFLDYKIRVAYSKTELVSSIDDIQHPSVRECLRFMGIEKGLEITIVSDLPARTGLGSSSSFTVGLLNALHAHTKKVVSREQLAAEAVHVEREMIKERVGLQDQYTCAIGGFLNLEFLEQNQVNINPVPIPQHRILHLHDHLMLFYTGIQRNAHDVLEEQITHTKNGAVNSQLSELKKLVKQGLSVLENNGNLNEFGELLHQGWQLKRQLSDAITNSTIDEAYTKAQEAGAVGGKLLGAGGGGFLLLFVEPDKQVKVLQALTPMRQVNFKFENQGSRLIFRHS